MQKRVQTELDEVFEGLQRPCTMNDIPRLKYLECCIKESMRLYPSVPNVKRYISEDMTLGGYKVPAGASISLHFYGLHRNEEFFPEPHAFRPERFLPEQSAGRHPFAFVPFSAGPRNCIGISRLSVYLARVIPRNYYRILVGQKFAMLEEKVLLSCLLRRFEFAYSSAREPVKVCSDLVLKPKDGMPLIVRPRSNSN